MKVYEIIRFCNDHFGINISSSYYHWIYQWYNWYKGYLDDFHKYAERDFIGQLTTHQMYRLNMGKRICEDWVSTILGDDQEITCETGQTTIDEFLQDNKFWSRMSEFLERTFATGTGAICAEIESVNYDNLARVNGYNYKLRFYDGLHVLPVSYDEEKCITDVIVWSTITHEGKTRYKIVRYNTDEKIINNVLVDNDFSVVDSFDTITDKKLFAVYKPNINNSLDNTSPMGVSVLDACLDGLKACDLAFNNFCKDIRLGAKKVFVNSDLVKYTDEGQPISPDELQQQLFMVIGSDLAEGKQTLYQDYNPSLRIDENVNAIKNALSMVALKSGLGRNFYGTNESSGHYNTATEFIGSQQDLLKNAKKHFGLISDVTCEFLAELLDMNVHDLSWAMDAIYLIDAEGERDKAIQEVQNGIMSKVEFRQKYYGNTEEEAKKALEENVSLEDLFNA